MPAPDVTAATLSAGKEVGRAFSVVSLLPSLFLVGVIWVLAAAHSFAGPPDPDALVRALESLSIGDVTLLVLAAFAIGYVLHPVQFLLTQVLEGYWGSSRPGIALMSWRVIRYRERQ